MSMAAQFVALAYAAMAVTAGSLLGGNSIEATFDLASGVALRTRRLVILRERFGGAVLFSVVLMG